MNKKQENKQTMWEAIIKLLDLNKEKVDAIPAFAESVVRLRQVMDSARRKIAEADNIMKGKAQEKMQAENELISMLVPVLAAIRVHAHKDGKAELEKKVDLTPTDLKEMRDTELKDSAVTLIALANEYASDLVQHGVKSETLTELQTKADAYQKRFLKD